MALYVVLGEQEGLVELEVGFDSPDFYFDGVEEVGVDIALVR